MCVFMPTKRVTYEARACFFKAYAKSSIHKLNYPRLSSRSNK